MLVHLVAQGGYVHERWLLKLVRLGFLLQKEFTGEAEGPKAHWVAVNTPQADLHADDLITISQTMRAPLLVDGNCSPPKVTILKN